VSINKSIERNSDNIELLKQAIPKLEERN